MLCLILLISCSAKTNAEPPDTGNGSAFSLSEHADAAEDGVLALLPDFVKEFLHDGINYRLNRYQSLKLDLFGGAGSGDPEFGQVLLQWRVALD
ncbi:MAG: hypothetical protein H0T87_01925 [Gammaproteobacteria bacterium]|nr:hypothetical protein [Gammaproteobacteria bacterium]